MSSDANTRAGGGRWSLAGRTALVTGATLGIGLAVAEEFLSFGARLLAVARDAARVEARVEAWRRAGADADGLAADLSTADGRARVLERLEAWGRLDVLVNNVGTNVRKAATDYTTEEYERVISTNLTSAFELTRAAHPLLKVAAAETGDAGVVNVASVSGLTHTSTGAPYAMSKAALLQLTRSLAVEWAGDNIRVNAVAPWYIRTPLVEPVLSDGERLARILSRTPMRRVGEPEEVAAVVAFLASDTASYLNGATIDVGGGSFMP